MKRYLLTLVALLGLIIMGVSCTYITEIAEERPLPSLKEVFKDYFPIGVAIETPMISTPKFRDLLLKQFNSVTAEIQMKMNRFHPSDGMFHFNNADRIVNL